MSNATAVRSTLSDEREYVLGTSAEESVRLGLQHRLWSASAHALWERAGIAPGQTVIDVGCGPGHAAMDLAQIVGTRGRVICVDESASYLHQVSEQARSRRLDNVDRILGDVQELGTLLSGWAGKIDAAYARWVLCFVADPARVIEELARLVRPGGRVAIQDYFNYETMSLAPKREEFTRVVQAVGRGFRDRGGDPDIVGRLPEMLHRHGFEVTHLSVNQRVARPIDPIWHWPDSFWRVFVPRLVASGHLDQDAADRFFAVWQEACASRDVFMFLPPVFDVIAVRR
ncbi:MAG: methyltransferase domain-containing protein [Phycisphaeraceae bacterium]|nr:methyltransferase domain-containing protein [Phycisphaerae bacterium]MBX3392867.1 methyltransferase domain-containing protein [Phycisphaeraceae bacterium]HRJ51019.1 methyltransferase domain-containing protein [Phycisphaerales bacterium]